jgi:hypothetical protein
MAIMVEARLSHRLDSRGTRRAGARVDAIAAVGAGLFAGSLVLLLLLFLAAAIYDESAWKLVRMMAAVVRGPSALTPESLYDGTLAAIGLGVHYALSILYALALAGLIADFRRAAAPWIGLAFGVALYFANLHGFTRLFPWFAELRTFDTLLAHAFFGLVLARAYRELAAARHRR